MNAKLEPVNSHVHRPILARFLDEDRKWSIFVHANDPRSFSCGFLEAVKHNRLCHNSKGLDELEFLIGTLTPAGGTWDYGWFDSRCLDSNAYVFERHEVWRSLVEYESEHIDADDHVRQGKIQQHIESARTNGRYINLIESAPGKTLCCHSTCQGMPALWALGFFNENRALAALPIRVMINP